MSDINNLKFTPHSDMDIDDSTTVTQHFNLIKNNKFSDATALLNSNQYKKGFRASIFNSMQDQIEMIQGYLLEKETTVSEDLYSETEPTDEDMGESSFWICPY